MAVQVIASARAACPLWGAARRAGSESACSTFRLQETCASLIRVLALDTNAARSAGEALCAWGGAARPGSFRRCTANVTPAWSESKSSETSQDTLTAVAGALSRA